MKIKWLGHASFLITADNGTRLITDPYRTGEKLVYREIDESADIVTASHDHFDHNNTAVIGGSPEIIQETRPVAIRGIKISGLATFHDEQGGEQRGDNIIFCLEIDGLNVCHLGDLGHRLSDQEAASLGVVDILLVPVGGNFTVDSRVATEICQQLAPSVIIPMHYQNDKCLLPIAPVDDFLDDKDNVSLKGSSEIEFKEGKLPISSQIIILEPAQ